MSSLIVRHGIPIPEFWDPALLPVASSVLDRLASDGLLDQILPSRVNVFRAFTCQEPRCVILGQDPYPSSEDAEGLAFSSPASKLPSSLRNIFKELQSDLGDPIPTSGDLSHWHAQGVLLANVGLTLGQDGKTHLPYWQDFAAAWISSLAKHRSLVWVLWGKHAQAWRSTIEASGRYHFIIESVHPSPLSAHRGFFGSKPFSKVNAELSKMGLPVIDWTFTNPQSSLDI